MRTYHPKDKNFKTCHEILDLGIRTKHYSRITTISSIEYYSRSKDYVFINNHDPRLFEGFSMGNP